MLHLPVYNACGFRLLTLYGWTVFITNTSCKFPVVGNAKHERTISIKSERTGYVVTEWSTLRLICAARPATILNAKGQSSVAHTYMTIWDERYVVNAWAGSALVKVWRYFRINLFCVGCSYYADYGNKCRQAALWHIDVVTISSDNDVTRSSDVTTVWVTTVGKRCAPFVPVSRLLRFHSSRFCSSLTLKLGVNVTKSVKGDSSNIVAQDKLDPKVRL